MTFRSTKGASKQRRDHINSMIVQLRELLPLPATTRQRLSQLQVMSAVCVYVRKSNYFKSLPQVESIVSNHSDFVQSLPGFILVISKDGKLVYISENVTDFLGHSMVDMVTQGDTIWDIVDKRDFNTLRSHLNCGPLSAGEGEQKTFFCRMNVARTLRRQSSFREQKVMVVRGHFLPLNEEFQVPGTSDSTRREFNKQPLFFALCTPLLTPEIKESLFLNNTDVMWMEHTNDMKIQACSPLVEHYLGLKEEEVIGRSWYELLHPDDLPEARSKHVKVLGMSSDMGVMLTTRLQTAAGAWQCTSSVLYTNTSTHESFINGRIFSMHTFIRMDELADFRVQCEQYTCESAHACQYLSLQNTGLYMSPANCMPGASLPQHLPAARFPPPLQYNSYPPSIEPMLQQPQNTYAGGDMPTQDGLLAEFMMDSSSSLPEYFPSPLLQYSNKKPVELKRKSSMDSCIPMKMQRTFFDYDEGPRDMYMSATYGHDSQMNEWGGSAAANTYNTQVMMRSAPVQYGVSHTKASLLQPDLPPTPECQPADRDIHDALTSSQTVSRSCLHSPAWAPPTPTPASPCFVPTTRTLKMEPSVPVENSQLPHIKAEEVIDFFHKTRETGHASSFNSAPTRCRRSEIRDVKAEAAAASMAVPHFDATELEWLERSFLNGENGNDCRKKKKAQPALQSQSSPASATSRASTESKTDNDTSSSFKHMI